MRRWYAVYCQSRMEAWARANLWERGLEVYLPRYLKRRRHARRTDWVPRPLFSGYLFVHANLDAGHERRVNSAPGVRYMVKFGGPPPPLADAIIAEIRGREDADGFVSLCDPSTLKPGARLRIEEGALRDQVGLFECAADDARVILLLNLLGRPVRVRLAADKVSPEP